MMESKTQTEVRAKIAELAAERLAPGTAQSRGLALYSMEMALRWASGEKLDADMNPDLARPIDMKWRKQEDGSYLSTAGYRIEKRYEGGGAGGTVWAAERPHAEPLPGRDVSSKLDYAKQHCQRDWQERLRGLPEL